MTKKKTVTAVLTDRALHLLEVIKIQHRRAGCTRRGLIRALPNDPTWIAEDLTSLWQAGRIRYINRWEIVPQEASHGKA